MHETSPLLDSDFSLEEELLIKKKKKLREEIEQLTHLLDSDINEAAAVTFLGPDGPVITYEIPGRGTQYAIPDQDHPIWVEWELLVASRTCLGAHAVMYTVQKS